MCGGGIGCLRWDLSLGCQLVGACVGAAAPPRPPPPPPAGGFAFVPFRATTKKGCFNNNCLACLSSLQILKRELVEDRWSLRTDLARRSYPEILRRDHAKGPSSNCKGIIRTKRSPATAPCNSIVLLAPHGACRRTKQIHQSSAQNSCRCKDLHSPAATRDF